LEVTVKLRQEEVEHIAGLARLALSDEEVARYQEQLSTILEHFEHLQNLDTEDVSPTATVLALGSVMRADEVRPTLPQERVLENAPEARDGCFQVPAVLE
jgi:aspartyl-tRNA(Asn)/glutamyl-tRNA(Gln) amidotransferase subunit C